MKNLLHNIQILAMLALMMAGIQSCSDDLQEMGDVEVSPQHYRPIPVHALSAKLNR